MSDHSATKFFNASYLVIWNTNGEADVFQLGNSGEVILHKSMTRSKVPDFVLYKSTNIPILHGLTVPNADANVYVEQHRTFDPDKQGPDITRIITSEQLETMYQTCVSYLESKAKQRSLL